MEKENFTSFEKINNILKEYDFFGMTCKRGDNGKLTYKYHNIHYFTVSVSVVTVKLQPSQFKSPKIVLSISINGRNIEGYDNFMKAMNNLGKIHYIEFPKTFKKLDNNGHTEKDKHCRGHHRSNKHRNHTNE